MKPRYLIPGVMALALVPVLTAQTTIDKSAPPSRIAGSWAVAYEDLALGEIDGVATVEPDGRHMKVVLTEPGTGHPFVLTSESVVEKGDDYTIILTGESPSSGALLPDGKIAGQASDANGPAIKFHAPPSTFPGVNSPPGAGGTENPAGPAADVRVELPAGAPKIEVQVADFGGQVALKPVHAVETNRIELVLHFGASGLGGPYSGKPEDRLTGIWRFFADPVTWRDGAGRGRVGYFRRDRDNPNYTTQSAAEVWVRGMPSATIQLLAETVVGPIKVSRFFYGVPTRIEAVFEDPQADETKELIVTVDGHEMKVTANRDRRDYRRFVTDPLLPANPARPAPTR